MEGKILQFNTRKRMALRYSCTVQSIHVHLLHHLMTKLEDFRLHCLLSTTQA